MAVDISKLKVGDKVRRIASSFATTNDVKVGDIFTYVGGHRDAFVNDHNGHFLGTACPENWELVTQKEEEKQMFKVGDKVRILDADRMLFGNRHFKTGDITTVNAVRHTGSPFLESVLRPGDELLITADERRYIELVKDTPTELDAILAQIEELTMKARELVEASKAEPKEDAFAEKVALAEKLLRKHNNDDCLTHTVYHVNEKKGVVVARVVGVSSGKTYTKGMARLAPGDKFDERIGKAIALLRTQGKDVPKELTR